MLAETTREAARRFGDRAVLCTADRTLSYAELDESAGLLAAGFARRGLGPGDVVALALRSGPEWLIAAAAASWVGAAVAGISPVLSPTERAEQVELVRPRLVLAEPSSADGLPLRTEVAVLRAGQRCTELAGERPADPVPHDPERLAVICFTSGTTGRAKAARFLGRHLEAVQRIDLGPAQHEWGGGAPMLASTQFAHVGMTLKLPWYLRTGSTLHVMERWRADDALELVARHRMPTLGVVAPQLALMLRSPALDRLDLSCVRAIIAGGAASPPTLVTAARERFGAAYSIRYSSTESGGVGLATAFDAPDDEALHTVGRPRPGVEARIADEEDRPLGDDRVGELQLRSPAVMEGYHGDAAATAAALTSDGWLRTGDLAHRRADGTIVLVGRRSDMYIRGGYNVFPEEVEAVLSGHPGVRSVAIGAAADDVMGETGVAVVVPADPDRPPSLESLRALGSTALARHKLPEQLVLVDELPLTVAQKIDRVALRSIIEARTLRS